MRAPKAMMSVLIVAMTLSAAKAQSKPDALEQELTALKDKLDKQLVAKGRKKVAALDFVDLQGQRNELGRYLAEQLTVELVGADGIAVLDRANLKSVLDEHKLTEEGLVKPENAKKLGEFAGVDAIIIGTLSVNDTDVVLLVKAISTETAEIVAAGRIKFPKTTEFQQLLSKGIIPGGEIARASSSGGGGTAAGSVDTNAIATKEIGRLRVTLKNVAPVKNAMRNNKTGETAQLITGVVCSFEFTNLDLQKTLKVANNGEAVWNPDHYLHRSKLTDSSGHEWRLADTTGLPLVACGYKGDASSIVRLILSGNAATEKLFDDQGKDRANWGGDFVSIEPGKTSRISMTFYDLDEHGRRTDYATKAIEFFQLESELVIGVGEPGNKEAAYKLEALVLDKVTMPKAGEAQNSKSNP